jgi:hypothetical protein
MQYRMLRRSQAALTFSLLLEKLGILRLLDDPRQEHPQ